jgi:triacylglycerol lipase
VSVGLPGVNDPSCVSADRPVVLLHGTFSSVRADYAAMVPALLASGRCLYGIDYGNGGRGAVRQSAADVSAFIDQVLAATGAEQVDVIGFSQGGLVLRTGLRLTGLAPKVAVAVLIAPSFHGSTSPLLTALPAGICPACADQAAGSSLLTELAAGGDLDGAVRYAVVSSADDTVVTPVAAQVPQGPADRVSSIQLQDRCPGEHVDHVSMRANGGVAGWVIDALATGGSPDPSALTCG